MENNVVGLIVLWKQMINNILIPLTPSRHHFQLWLLVSGFKWTDENQLRHLQSWSRAFTFCGSDSPSSAAAAAAASFSSISFSTWWKEKEKLPSGEKKRLQPVSWVLNYHHSDFSSFSCHSWLKPLVEDKSRAEQKDWLEPQKLLWVGNLSPHFPILSLPWLTWEAARFERTSRWFRTPWLRESNRFSRFPRGRMEIKVTLVWVARSVLLNWFFLFGVASFWRCLNHVKLALTKLYQTLFFFPSCLVSTGFGSELDSVAPGTV